MDVLFDDVSVEHRPGLQVQENQYDPWGLSLAGLDYSTPGLLGLNKYQFNGKEKQTDLGLGWSDYGARLYTNDAPHWITVDPLADKMRRWSPYAFSFDNPLRFMDPDGMAPLDNYVFNEKGNYVRTDKNDKPDALVIENSKTAKQQTYQFNYPVADVQAIKNGIAGKGGINKVEVLTDSKVEKMITESGVKSSEARKSPLLYAWKEGANKMDYGATGIGARDLNTRTFYIREGVAYNVGDMGNYLFGRGAAELGISVGVAQTGGQVNNMLSGRTQKTPLYTFGPGTNGPPAFFDSPGDQRAIYNGHTNSPVGAEILRQSQKVQEMNDKYGSKF